MLEKITIILDPNVYEVELEDPFKPFTYLVGELLILTIGWEGYDLVPDDNQKARCKALGRKLHDAGGWGLMKAAYDVAIFANPSAKMIDYFWDRIGDWLR